MFRGNLHTWYQEDPWIKQLDRGVQPELDTALNDMEAAYAQNFADTATWGLEIYERELGLSKGKRSLEDRRSAVQAGWQRGGRIGIQEIQTAANSWRNGAVQVAFKPPVIVVEFVSVYGIPTDLDGLKAAIGLIKPAHLAIEYIFRFMTWDEFDAYGKTWDQWDALGLTWDELETYHEEA